MHMAGMHNLSLCSSTSINRSTSAAVRATGFSSNTCLPAFNASIARSMWVSVGVQMLTASMSSACRMSSILAAQRTPRDSRSTSSEAPVSTFPCPVDPGGSRLKIPRTWQSAPPSIAFR